MLDSILSSPRSTLSPQKMLDLASSYLDTARKVKDLEIALVLCDDAEASLSQMKKAVKKAQAPKSVADQTLRDNIAKVYFERGQVLEGLAQLDKAEASYKKAEKWGYEGLPAGSTTVSTSSLDSVIGVTQSTEFFPARASLTPSPKVAEVCPQEKHQWVAQVFETILKQFQDLDLCQSSPSLFLVYAHNNHRLGKADAEASQRVIQWLSNLRSNLYSDRSAGGHQALPLSTTLEDTAKANDILSSQLCLLPNHAGTVDHVVLCGSELLGHYMASPYYQGFYEAIQRAYQQASQQANDFAQVEAEIRKVVDANLNEAEFHHVLTELAFLQIRYEYNKDKHGTIPLLLNSTAGQCLPKFIIDSTTIRIEDSIWRAPNLWNGRQTYQDEGLHIGFFKLLKRLLVKQEGHIALVEETIYQACLKNLREDHTHTLTAEEFSLFLNQACVAALDALKKEGASDLREVNIQRAYESLRAEIKQINGEALVAPDQLRSALAASYAAKELGIQRLSGPALSMEHCYINLAIVEYEKIRLIVEKPEEGEKKEAEEKKVTLNQFHRLPSYEAIDSNQQKLVPLDKLFDPRELSQGKTATSRRILIRGRAGVGKTTLSKKIVYEYTQKGQWRDRFDHVLWISLRTLKGKSNYDLVTLFHETYFQHHPKGLALAKTLDAQINGPAKEKTLFILDGWDEVAQEWGEHEPMAQFLTQLLNQPTVLITSRPYVDLRQAQPMDLELETVGFSPENVMAYLDNPAIMPASQAQEMKHFIQSTPFIQGLVNVPIQLDALCYSWDEIKRLQQATQGVVTVTSLYQAMMDKLWRKDMMRLGKRDAGEKLTASHVDALSLLRLGKLVKAEQDFLSTLAFRGLQNNQIEFRHSDLHALIDQLETEEVNLPFTLEANLKKLSFLHADDAEEGQHSYHFMHLTFQEFFAAKHFVQCWEMGQEITLLSADAKQWTKAPPEAFVRQHKYNPRYEILWWFISGLLRGQALSRFFDLLEAEPRDLFGAHHQRLMMSCLHEASGLPDVGLSSKIRDELEQHLEQWLGFEIDQRPECTLAYQPTFPESLLLKCLKEATSVKTKRGVAEAFSHRSTLPDAAIQALIALAKDKEDAWGRYAAAQALGKQTSLPVAALQSLIAMTRDKDKNARYAAAQALGKQTSLPDVALQSLIVMTGDNDDEVRCAVAEALGKQASLSDTAFQALIEMAEDVSNKVRCAIVRALGEQASLPDTAFQALTKMVEDGSDEVRGAVAMALGEQASLPEVALQMLAMLIVSGQSTVKYAAEVLRKQAQLPEVIFKGLITMAKEEEVLIRSAAAEGLGRLLALLPEAALPSLIAMVRDNDGAVRCAVAEALGKQASLSDAALGALIAMAGDKQYGVRRAVALALGQLALLSDAALEALIALTRDEESMVRSVAAGALGQHASLPDAVLEILIVLAQAKDEDSYVRRNAAHALGKQTSLSDAALGTLIALTKDETGNVRYGAAEALGEQTSLPDTALQALIALVEDKEEFARLAAAHALGQQASLSEAARQALIVLTRDKADYLSHSAIQALKQLASLSDLTFQALVALLKEKETLGRYAAAQILGKHSATIYRLLPTFNERDMKLLYKECLLPQRFDQSKPFYIKDGALCFYTAEGLQTVPFPKTSKETAFKQAVKKIQQAVGVPLPPTEKVGLLRNL